MSVISKQQDPRRRIARILTVDAQKDPVINGSRERLAKLVDDAPSQMSRLMTGHVEDFSTDRLIHFSLRRGFDVEIRLRKLPRGQRGKLTVKAVR